MREVNKWLLEYWIYILMFLLAIILVGFLQFFRIVSTPEGYSPIEWVLHNNMAIKLYSFSYIWHHVIFAPYYLSLMVPEYLNRYGLFAIRGVGAIYGVICVFLFYYINWRWWGNLIAILSTTVFSSSLWFLQVSRNSGPIILYVLAALTLIILGFVVRNKKRHDTKTLVAALIALLLLYIPGMVWFVLAACILQRELVIKEFKKLFTQVKIIIPLGGILLLSPLIYRCVTNLAVFRTFLGLPQHFSFNVFLHNLVNWILIIFIRSPSIGYFSVGHLPILSIFVDVMFILGLYWLWLKRKLDRIYLLGATLLLAWFLYALGGPVSIYLSMPFIFCIAATGMAYTIGQWFTVFPRNPVARSVGIIVLSLVVIVVCLYHIDEYFVAWPKTPNTIIVYSTHKL